MAVLRVAVVVAVVAVVAVLREAQRTKVVEDHMEEAHSQQPLEVVVVGCSVAETVQRRPLLSFRPAPEW